MTFLNPLNSVSKFLSKNKASKQGIWNLDNASTFLIELFAMTRRYVYIDAKQGDIKNFHLLSLLEEKFCWYLLNIESDTDDQRCDLIHFYFFWKFGKLQTVKIGSGYRIRWDTENPSRRVDVNILAEMFFYFAGIFLRISDDIMLHFTNIYIFDATLRSTARRHFYLR